MSDIPVSDTITVYGASDDLIEIEGAIREEFYLHNEDDGDLLAFSTGALLRVRFTDDSVWRIEPISGTDITVKQAVLGDDDNYSDRATILIHDSRQEPLWVVHGMTYGR